MNPSTLQHALCALLATMASVACIGSGFHLAKGQIGWATWRLLLSFLLFFLALSGR